MALYQDVIFPYVLDFVMSRPHMMKQRPRALAEAKGEVLEIGFGTGLNLPHYPQAVERLTITDPARLLDRTVEERIQRATMPIERAHVGANELPFDAGRFDSVVSTWTLCTIGDVENALREIRRVLRPEGALLFVEHGRSDHPNVARWQDRLNPIQRAIGVGCNLNRPIDRLIESAGFEIGSLERFVMPKTPRILGETYLGVARPA